MTEVTPLASSQINNHDRIAIELVEPGAIPAKVKINWPEHPSLIDPTEFGDTASNVVRLFSEAHVTLARIKARRYR
jgi:hypothetical protein